MLSKPTKKDGTFPTLVVNEFLATRVALALGVPVPLGEIGQHHDDRRSWVSAQVSDSGEDPAPPDPRVIAARYPSEIAAITVFDVLVHNGDRHDGNLIFTPKLGLWAIDHDQAFGGPRSSDVAALGSMASERTRLWFADDAGVTPAQCDEWVGRAAALPPQVFKHATRDAQLRGLVNGDLAQAFETVLSERQARIRALVRSSLRTRDDPPTLNA